MRSNDYYEELISIICIDYESSYHLSVATISLSFIHISVKQQYIRS